MLYDVDSGNLLNIIGRPAIASSNFKGVAYTADGESILATTDSLIFRFSKGGDLLQTIRGTFSSEAFASSLLRPEMVAMGD